ncbi:site-specific integrase [Peribacillus asahii]|uniref:site-specific integrase n=1 Tax=Peribacillus asahii TaxID=228899 RepID=UPI0038099E66
MAYFLLFKTLIDTGMRKGEALALQWKDIDFSNKKIKIYKTIVYDKKAATELFGPPKTDSSYRSILVDDTLLNILKKQEINQKERKLKLGEAFDRETKLIFDRGDGLPFAKSTLQKAFRRICKKAGISKHITIHGLRHTHAVLLLESGSSLKEVQERLGHKTIQTTADTYAHVSEVLEARGIDNYSKYMNYNQYESK